jgi:hypothetical protein
MPARQASANGSNAMGARALRRQKPRGVALLLVMIGLIVCTLLTAGFLASQGTSIGIARNERDAERARAAAQTGIDLCYYLMRNRRDWRTAMNPGYWLTNFALADGSVTVNAASEDGGASFSADTTQAVVFTSTGTVNNRAYTLTATIGPTGGGTIYRGGNFCKGRIVMGVNDLSGACVIDSYNSSVAAYNPILPGSNAVFSSNYGGNYGLIVYALSAFHGSFVGGSQQNLSNAVYQTLGALGPVSTSIASEPFTLGRVVLPNMADLTSKGVFFRNLGYTLSAPGIYDSFTVNPNSFFSTTVNIGASGIYHVTGNFALNSNTTLNINDGVKAVIVVDGNATLSGSIKLSGSATLDLYVDGSVTMNGAVSVNNNGNTSAFTLLTTGGNDIYMNGSTAIYGAIYAPRSTLYMQGFAPKVYGAIISQNVSMQNTAAFHFDEKLKDKRIDNITGGSAPQGDANYTVTIVGSTALGST